MSAVMTCPGPGAQLVAAWTSLDLSLDPAWSIYTGPWYFLEPSITHLTAHIIWTSVLIIIFDRGVGVESQSLSLWMEGYQNVTNIFT